MPATCSVRGLCSRYSHIRGAPHLAVRAPHPTTQSLENGPLREDLSDTELTFPGPRLRDSIINSCLL